MTEKIYIDNVEYWHDVIVAHLLHGECSGIGSDFKADFSVNRNSDIQFSRIRSVAHRFERTEKHVRNSKQTDFVLILQLRGNSVQVQDGRELLLHPGDITCLDGTRPLHLELMGEFEHLVVHIPREIVSGSLGPTERFTAIELSKRNPIGPLLVSFLEGVDSILDSIPSPTASRLSQTAVALIMTALAEQSSMKLDHPSWSRNALLFRAEEFIRRHSRSPGLTSQAVADALNISLRYLQEIFQAVKQTPSEFIWQCRLRNSEEDLVNPCFSSLSIGEIALRSGFSDFGHFGRRFKASKGISPREFRAKLQNGQDS